MSIGRFYLKTVAVLVLLAVIIVTILSIVLNRIYADTAVEEVQQVSLAMVDRSSYYAEFVHRQVMTLGAALLTGQAGNDAILEYLLDDSSDALVRYFAQQTLTDRVEILGFARSLGLYNARSESYVSTSPALDLEESVVSSVREGVDRAFSVSPHLIGGDQVLRYVIYDNSFPRGSTRNAVVIDIHAATLGDHANTSEFLAGNLEILGPDGNVLHSDTEVELRAGSDQSSATSAMLDLPGSHGTVTHSLNGRDFLTTYQRSDATGWTIVNHIPYDSITATAATVQRQTISAAMLMLAFSLGLVGALSRYLYRPIGSLAERYLRAESPKARIYSEVEAVDSAYQAVAARAEELHRRSEADRRELADRFLARAMTTGLSSIELREGLDRYGVAHPTEGYRLIVIDADAKESTIATSPSLGAVTDYVRRLSQYRPIRLGAARWAVMWSLESEQSLGTIKSQCSSIQATLDESEGVSVSIAISRAKASMAYLRSAHDECMTSLKHRLSRGPRLMMAAEDEPEVKDPAYPTHLENELANGIRLIDRDRYLGAVDEVLAVGLSWSGQAFEYVITQLSLEAHKHIRSQLAQRDSSLDTSFLLQSETLMTAYGPDRIRAWFVQLFDQYEELGERWTRLGPGQMAKIQKAMEYIEQHFEDPLLTLDEVAEELNLSRAHLSRLFKKANHITFSAHLAQLRLLQAQKLLVESEKSMEEVCSGAGFNSIHYFYHFFKRHTGVTPLQYRHTHAADAG
jgi:two-component system, response regulator YesN